MQVYRGLRVLTAAPDAASMALAPHRLYGVIDPAEPCSAGHWRALAIGEIESSTMAGRLPILVGGTGLYLRTLIAGIARIPPVPPAVRDAVRRRLAEEGAPALHSELFQRDPVTAARLVPRDSQRIGRALEVLEATGRPMSAWLHGPADGDPGRYRFLVILLMPPRETLYESIGERFATMVAAGGLEEVRALAERGLDPALPAMKALGVPELLLHISGEIALDEAIRLGQQATRRYAKRQVTWFRHQIAADRIVEAQYSERVGPEIFSLISRFLLTGHP
jgi:tRNA dimethylallyltransferase